MVDLNGIPLNAIERIEVLLTSASAVSTAALSAASSISYHPQAGLFAYEISPKVMKMGLIAGCASARYPPLHGRVAGRKTHLMFSARYPMQSLC